jgi:hypothetical protein
MVEKAEKVTLVYREGKVYLTGDTIKGVLEVSTAELTKIYYGKEGAGTIHIKIED